MEQAKIARNSEVKFAIVVFLAAVIVPSFLRSEIPWISPDPVIQWLAGDYSKRALILAVIFAVPLMRRSALSSFNPLRLPTEIVGMTILRVGIAILVCLLLSAMAEFFIRQPLLHVFPDTRTFVYPRIESVPVYWLDMTFGLALTAVSEELAFRSVARDLIERFTANKFLLVAVSSVLFGIVHWPHGLPNVIDAVLFGAILMVLYVRMNSVVPPIIVHYLVNIWYFA